MQSAPSPEAASLGEFRKKYSFNWLAPVGLLILSLFFAAAPAYDISLGSFGVFDAVCSGLALLPLVYAVILISTAAGKSVDVHEGGFIYRDSGKNIAAAWEDIETVWFDQMAAKVEIIPLMLRYILRMRLRDGREVVIKQPIGRMPELGDRIMSEHARRSYPQALARLEKGEMLDFGKYRITKDALIADGKELTWDKRPQLGIVNNSVTLHAKGDVGLALKSMVVSNPTKTIPNLYLLLALIHHYVNDPEEALRDSARS